MFVTLLAGVASAEDSAFTGTQAEVVEKPETHVTGELGGALATGNSNFYTVNGLLNASHKVKLNKVSAVAGLNLGSAKTTDLDGDAVPDVDPSTVDWAENVRRYYAEARYDRFLSDNDSIYALAGGFSDRFAGFDLRTHEQLGYSRLLVKNDKTELKGEFGGDVAQENYVTGTEPNYQNIIAARILLGINHKFNDKVGISDTFETYENVLNFDDVRILNTAALTSTLSGKLSLKLSHTLIFDNVPVEGFQKLDQTTMVTLVASLL
jgi:putative salt-induced outer membrane protein YdiY